MTGAARRRAVECEYCGGLDGAHRATCRRATRGGRPRPRKDEIEVLAAEVTHLRARLAEVIAIHQETADGYCAECTSDYCGDAEPVTYPCATASAARGEGDR